MTERISAPSSNHGLATATSGQVTAELDPALIFVDAWSAPSPAASPQAGEIITWDLPDLGFLGGGWVDLWVRLPAAEVGTSYPLTFTVSSGEPDANPSDNAVVVEVTVVRQMYLPLVLRGQ